MMFLKYSLLAAGIRHILSLKNQSRQATLYLIMLFLISDPFCESDMTLEKIDI